MTSKVITYSKVATAFIALSLSQFVLAEVEQISVNPSQQVIQVSDDSWQPEGFVNGTPVPAAWIPARVVSQ